MIRQAINCDICGAEKQASTYWFVAYEQGGELKLRGWESPQNSRKNAKHLCGQKCAQRLIANFLATLTENGHGLEQGKEAPLDAIEQAAMNDSRMEVSQRSERHEHSEKPEATDRHDRTDRSLIGRAAIDSGSIGADSWAGPVRPKEESWEAQNKLRTERESFLNATRSKLPSRLQRMA